MTGKRNTYIRWGLLGLILLPFVLQAQQRGGSDNAGATGTAAVKPGAQKEEKAIVDYDGELMTKRAGDTALYLIGNVAFHHNGTFIQCDSAKRYDGYRMECFGNVVINKDSTFIYGDQASYDGRVDIVKVYSPLLKLVNGDAVMWINNYMEFNTKTNVGNYTQGGVIEQRDNLMESDRGIYNGDSSLITFIGRVAMRNDNYKMRTDSISYHLNREVVTFLTRTYIWDKERDFLMADRGNYIRSTETYHFTENAYAMTKDQEFWADTMDYESIIRQVTLRRNIQILDTTQNAIGLGDYGFYNDSLKNGMLTDNPAVILYDTIAQGDSVVVQSTPFSAVPPLSDSISSRSDTTISVSDSTAIDTTAPMSMPTRPVIDTIHRAPLPDSTFARADTIILTSYPPGKSKPKPPVVATAADSLRGTDSLATMDSLAIIRDSLPVVDSLPLAGDSLPDSLSSTPPPSVDTLGTVASADTLARIIPPPIGVEEPPAPVAPDTSLLATGVDSTSLSAVDSMDSTRADSTTILLPALTDSTATGEKDSLERVIRAFRNVKLWRKDVQGVADSMIAYSVDSMSSLFGRPIIWNSDNQLTADQIDIYSRNEQLDYAEYTGDPFITQEIKDADSLFNQAQGRFLQTWFKDNSISRSIMTGNVINYYFMGEDSLPPDKMFVISAASLTIDFENQEPVRFNWGGQAEWHIDPLDKLPPDQGLRLSGFSWEPERKPKDRYAITHRSVRESQRAVASGYKPPVFNIEEQFKRTKEALLKGGTWRDRNEPMRVSIETFNNNTLLYQ